MEESLEIDLLRHEFQQLRKKIGNRLWKDQVRRINSHYTSGQGLLDMNAVRDNQANYARTLRLLRAMRLADTKPTSRTIRKQGLVRPQAAPPAARRKRASKQKENQ
jgi:hypothetical protein